MFTMFSILVMNYLKVNNIYICLKNFSLYFDFVKKPFMYLFINYLVNNQKTLKVNYFLYKVNTYILNFKIIPYFDSIKLKIIFL